MKKIGFFIYAVAINASYADTCDPGYYYNDNNECVACNTSAAYYCPGDGLRHLCPTIDIAFDQWAYDTYGFSGRFSSDQYYWTNGVQLRTQSQDCVSQGYMQNDVANKIYFSVRYDTTQNAYRELSSIYYMLANPGYYLKRSLDARNEYFLRFAVCTNAPLNAHYTGPGTNDTYDGSIVDANDCPWECNSGYGQTDDGQCLPLCQAGITELHAGNLVFNIYANKQTTPALNVKYNDTVCYVSLEPGIGTNALHMTDGNGTIYHTTN